MDYLVTLGDPGLVTQSKEFSIKALQKRAFDSFFENSWWGEQDSNLRS
ncbi:hypothetical protein [Altibacter sp. HG106]|nr:hypothetical protein [Altibacter sp. HG106]MDC7996103.1 hypothetical protein [Altibacter sp. HG106]